MIWVEQPAGTGFSSKGTTPAATSEEEVAAQFAGFWKNFIETFHLQHKKVYLTGESYAGLYVPYIASHFISQNNTALYDVHGIMIYDPATTYDVLMTEIPATPFVDYWAPLFGLNKTFMDDIHNRSEICGYNAFLEEALVYPPKGPLPTPPNADGSMIGCSLWEDILEAVSLVNPCFDIYQVATTCPLLYDVLGYPGSFGYLPDGAQVYFNRTDVQKAINAPIQPWEECTDGILTVDNSDYSAFSVLPGVIEHTNNVIIGQGMMDFIIIYNGTCKFFLHQPPTI
jgi:carboxypeptidase D